MEKKVKKDTRFTVFNSSSIGRLPIKRVKELADNVFGSQETYSSITVNFIYLDDQDIHKMNLDYLGHDYPTDVISFTLEDDPVAGLLEGEIYIGVETAARQAPHYGATANQEISRLAVHGCLHLLGWDDQTPEDKARMTQEENKYLGYEPNKTGPLS